MNTSNTKIKRAFTLVEILTVIVLLSLLLTAAVPFFSWAQSTASDNTACSKAIILNSAKSQYLLEYGSAAYANFNGLTNANKYANILAKTYLGYVPTSLTSYVPAGYTFSIGNLNAKTAVTNIGRGVSLSY
jgi:prepilin-type N-terminal cleavage/methylation domain-containing protein